MQETNLQNLVINKVESQEVYDALNTNGAINDNELYLVGGDSSVDSVNGQTGDVNLDIPVVHKVESQDAYDEMVTAGQINDGELYLVQGDEYVQYTEQELTEEQKAQARENIDAVSSDNFTAAASRYSVLEFFGGQAGQLVPGLKGHIIIALKPAAEADQSANYKQWNLTEDDYPLFSICTYYKSGGIFPSFGGRVVAASGRVFDVGGGANLIQSWTPTEIYSHQMMLESSTENSTKKFKITVDDSGTLTATEVS